MFNEDLKYIIKSTAITLIPTVFIIIITEFIVSLIFGGKAEYEPLDICIRSIVITQFIGLTAIMKRKNVKNRDIFEKVITLRQLGLNTVYYLLSLTLFLYISSYTVILVTGGSRTEDLNARIFLFLFLIIIMTIFRLNSAKRSLA